MKHTPVNQADYYDTFPAYLAGIAEKYGDAPAISYFDRKQERSTHTYRQLVEDALSLTEALVRRGLSGKHIAVVGENSYEWLLAYLGAASCGGVAVCIDVEQSDDRIRQMILQADCSAVFAAHTFLPICAPLAQKGLELFCLGEADPEHPAPTLAQLRAEGAAQPERTAVAIDPGQAASIVYTSGTTSLAKPVLLSHKAILYNASDAIEHVFAGATVFSALPFYHSYGMTGAVLDTLVRGAHLTINGNIKTMMRDLHLAATDSLITVPLIVETIHKQLWLTAEREGTADHLRALLKACRQRKRFHMPWENPALKAVKERMLGPLSVIVCGGAHLEKDICEEFELLGVLILQGYGITECAPMVSTNGNYRNKMGSVGLVMRGYEVKIEQDEILVKGVSLMNGYYNQPEATEEAFADGWFKTGDLGYLDKNGYLSITGRKKNLIVFKNGKKVSPEQLEELVRRIPMVKEAMVYGAVSGSSADDVKLAVSIYPDPIQTEGLSSYDILEHLQKEVDQINLSLPSHQQIQMINIRETEFEKTASKKIKRHLV